MGLNPITIVANAIDSLLNGAPLEDIRTGFNFGYVFELLDISRSGSIKDADVIETHVMVLSPATYNLNEPFASTLTPAMDGTIIAEESGVLMRSITLEGTMGVRTKRATGFDGRQAQGAVSGHAHFLHLRNLFRIYSDYKQQRASKRVKRYGLASATPSDVVLVFHALREDDHFVVVPQAFETPRDAQSRVHYKYRIQMTAVAETDRIFKEDQGLFGLFDDVVSDINGAINDARAFFVELNAAVDEIKDRVRNIEQIAFNAAQAVNALNQFSRNVQGFVPFTVSAMQQVIADLELAADTLADSVPDWTEDSTGNAHTVIGGLSQALGSTLMHPQIFGQPPSVALERLYAGEQGLREQDLQDGTAGARLGSRTRIHSGTAQQAGLTIGQANATVDVNVSRADTIESIARRFGVSVEALVVVNDLLPPYIAPGGGPGVKAPGDTLTVPILSATGSDRSPGNTEYRTPDETRYGIDLALDPTSVESGILELQLDAAHGYTDVALVGGVPNVIQGLQIELNTEKGETAFLPVGIRRSVGLPSSLNSLLLSSVVLRDALLADPRIEGIQSSRISLEGDVVRHEITPVLTGGRIGASLTIPFGRAEGLS
jgi:LysM repeat protein